MAKEKFFTQELFDQSSKIQISYREAARRFGTTKRTAINRFQKDIENSYITKQATTYKCRRYKPLLDGKNIYCLTDKGKDFLGIPLSKQEKERQKDNALLAVLKEWMISFQQERKSVFEKVLQLCPHWWSQNPKLLQKTLLLLRKKILKGYRVRAPLRWISAALKDSGAGFRRKLARRYATICCLGAFATRNSAASPFFSSPYIAEGIGNLTTLAKKGLDVSEESMLFLLHKGFDQLAQAAKVLLRIERKREIENFNGFLNWLVSLSDPFSVFQKEKSNLNNSAGAA